MNRPTNVAADAVLFDLDDTLLDTNAAWAAGMDPILRRCPHSAGYRDGATAFPDVHACLESLHGFKLGIVTNGDGAHQRAKLQSLGLDDRFDVFLASGDVGFPKPDKRIFETAAAASGRRPATLRLRRRPVRPRRSRARSQLGCAGFG